MYFYLYLKFSTAEPLCLSSLALNLKITCYKVIARYIFVKKKLNGPNQRFESFYFSNSLYVVRAC